MNGENKIENQLATLAIDNDQEIANFVDLIDSSLEPYRIQVSELGLEAGRDCQKAITKQKNKVAKFFKEKRDYFNSMSKKIIGVEKTINAPLLELEEDLKAQCEAEVLRQEKAYRVSMRPIRQASLEGLGLHIDEEALDSMTDTEFNEQVSAMLAQIAQAKKEEEEAKKRAEELEKAKAEAAEKAKKEAEAKAQADKERILGESRYAIIEGLGLAGYTTASKQIVIEKAGAMDEETWDLSLASLKARKFEAEEKAEADKETARLKQEQEDKQNQELQAFLIANGYVEGQDKLVKSGTKTEIWRCVAVLEAK